MNIKSLIVSTGFAIGLTLSSFALTEAESRLHIAAAAGDSEKVALALLEADPDVRNAQGLTPLMLAARKGDFESVRRLVWGGADARLKSPDGKMARDFLSRSAPEYTETNLILRAYAFVKTHGKQNGKPKNPELTIISDNYTDHEHPMIKDAYRVNQAEARGLPGKDDDNNGFIDDVYGWDLAENAPERKPELAIDESPETQAFLKELFKDYQACRGSSALAKAIKRRLENQYENPLVRQIGMTTLNYGKIELNDYVYADMLFQSSHGTHVAGIVLKESDGVAKLVSTSWGGFGTRDPKIFQQIPKLIGMAKRSETYADFIESAVEIRRGKALAVGKRGSQFVSATGAGVANMSWSRGLSSFKSWAKNLEIIYKSHGKNPDTIANPKSEGNLDLIDNLPLELLVSDAAMFALIFYENPDVLFVIAAGNENSDNDAMLPSPTYLARFFPNVISVASHSNSGRFSSFSNRGVRSVSLAAPGEAIESALLAGLEGPMNGTSMAAPAVAGVSARIRKENPNLTAYDVRQILESTVSVKPEWEGKLTTSGMMDKPAALAKAKAWASGNASIIRDEVRRATREVEQRAASGSATMPQPDPSQFPIKSGSGPLNLVKVEGSLNGWKMVMQAGSKITKCPQVFTYSKLWPGQWVSDHWAKGYRISDVGGSMAAGWAVTMDKKATAPGQRTIGFKIDQEAIIRNMSAGYRITSLSGWGQNWLICMTDKTGWGKQRFCLPSPFDARRIEWLKARWNEGYRITSLGGDDLPGIDDDGYMLIMTLDSGLDKQQIIGPGVWPTDKITEFAKQGYAITSVGGAAGRWLVVLSSNSGVSKQNYNLKNTPIVPSFINSNW